ncbi:MAG: hypothetical protein ACPLYE_01335 [Candidatus Micrarchaeales archaeon]|jgi:hypothetical protein
MKAQSSFELLITLSFGLAVLLPIVVIAFMQIASSSSSLSAIESQQAASKIASIASFVGSEGPPAKQVVQIQVPPGVQYIYVGSQSGTPGHLIIFMVRSPSGLSSVTAYTPVNVSGNLGGISATGTYLINVTAMASCPTAPSMPCVYITPLTK